MAIRARLSRWLDNRIWRFTIDEWDRRDVFVSFCVIRSGDLLQNLRLLAFLTVFVCLCSCEGNFFGPEAREIAGGYRLKRTGNPGQFALTIPNEDGGLIVDEIGWYEPFIAARASGSEYWDLVDTAHARHIRVSDLQLKSNPIYQPIQIKSAEIAWKDLHRYKRLW